MAIEFEHEINFQSNTWNRDAWARIQADLNSEKESICYVSGQILGVRPGEAVKQLCGFETFLCTRLMPAAEDGSIRRLNKEVIFYTDSRTGQMIDEWTNPWTEEKVKVVHVANDPFNLSLIHI